MASQQCSESVKFDTLLKGGHLIDPKNGISAVRDVAISGKCIAAVDTNIPAETANKVIDVSGMIVTPGLVDIHVHIFPQSDWMVGSVIPDGQSWRSGVTTMVDAGTAGPLDFGRFKERVIDKSGTRIYAFINIADHGMGPHEQDRNFMKPDLTAGVCKTFKEAVGVKSAHYWTRQPHDDKHAPWDNVQQAVQAGELCQMPVMVDFWPRPPERSYEELILKKLRPGDIHTHVFAQQHPIVLPDGKINPALFEARKRGVIFDVGHGSGSFWFRNAVPCYEQGFPPDSLGTDLHTGNAATGSVGSLMDLCSKMMAMGMPLEETIYRATVTPAQEIGHSEHGHLSIGAIADIAVFSIRKGEFKFRDCPGGTVSSDRKLECMLTFQNGGLAFDGNSMTGFRWQDGPPSYWVCP
jgi:dihydroorotase